MSRRGLQAALLFAVIVACDSPADAYPGQISRSFDGNRQLVLVARYSAKAQSVSILAWADADVGTAATVEMTGPLHMHCDGTFQPVPHQYNDPGGRPALDVGDGYNGAQFHAPPGTYRVVVNVPSLSVQIDTSLQTNISTADPLTGVWDLPKYCVQVADTRQELHDLVAQRVHAVSLWIGRVPDSARRARLAALASSTDQALVRGDPGAALEDLVAIRSDVMPGATGNPEYSIFRDANCAIALLSQPLPAA